MQKLTSLPFQACQHRVSSLDAQPSMSGGILVFVTGQLLPEGETNPLKFSQTFHLVPVGGSFMVSNGEFILLDSRNIKNSCINVFTDVDIQN